MRVLTGKGNTNRFAALGKDYFAYGFMAGVSQLAGFFLLPVFTHVFSTTEYGVVEIVITIVALTATCSCVSLPSALQRYFFECGLELDRLVSTVLVFVAVLGSGFLLLSILLSEFIAGRLFGDYQYGLLIILGCASALFHALSSIAKTVLRMERKVILYNLLEILYVSIYAGLALYFVLIRQSGIAGMFVATLVASILRFCVSVASIRRHLTRKLSPAHLKSALQYSLPMFPAVLGGWVNNQLDRFLLLMYLGLSDVGVFGAASRIGMGVTLLVRIFKLSWAPHSVAAISLQSQERNEFYQTALIQYSCIFASLGLILTALSPEVFSVLVPDEYHSGYVVIPWIVGAAVLHTSASITTMGVVISKKTYANSVAAWSGVVLNVMLAFLLIPAFGILGAAVGKFMAELTFTALLWCFSTRFSDVRFPRGPMVKLLISYVVTGGILLWIPEFIPPAFEFICRLLLLLGALVFINGQRRTSHPGIKPAPIARAT